MAESVAASRPRAALEVFDLERIDSETGTLYVGELARMRGPFERFFFITGVPAGAHRGGHAHKHQDEYLVCVAGSVVVHIESHGQVEAVELDRPGRCLYLPAGYWRDLVGFSPEAVLAVLSRSSFSESDYIRDRAAYRRWENEPAA